MTQPKLNHFLQEFESQLAEVMRSKPTIQNSGKPPKDSWIEKVVSKVRISDLASEFGVNSCPLCNYSICFDDSRGWFICVKAKYEGTCNFKGNIVNFMERFG